MVKFKSKKDGFIFEAIEGSIHYDILVKSEEFEIVEEEKPKKKKKTGE